MKIPQLLFVLIAFVTTLHALTLPESRGSNLLRRRNIGGRSEEPEVHTEPSEPDDDGEGGGSSPGDSPGSSPGSHHSTAESGEAARTARLGSADSNTGGETPSGTGVQPRTYASGKSYYYGGSTVPYRAGARSEGGIEPTFLPAEAIAFFPGVWRYGAYEYPYTHPYTYHNFTSNGNETKPVECLCARFQECGCDQVQNNETAYINHVANNRTMARLANVHGKQTLVINGTLPNGTTVASAAPSFKQGFAGMSGLWVIVAGVVYTAWFF